MTANTRDNKGFATNLRSHREAMKLSQSQLSIVTGLSQTVISQYEDGQRYPSPKSRKLLTESLKLTPEFFAPNLVNSAPSVTDEKEKNRGNKDAAIKELVSVLRGKYFTTERIEALIQFLICLRQR
jgi:transcriptional regulator with XRE-family HTH domain